MTIEIKVFFYPLATSQTVEAAPEGPFFFDYSN